MRLLNRLPLSARYFIAKLRPIGRPSFWIPALLLSVAGIAIGEYVLFPESLPSLPNADVTTTSNNADQTALSPEDQSIGADIDTLPPLLKQINQAPPSTLSPTAQKTNTPQPSISNNLPGQSSAQQQTQSNPATSTNPPVSAPVNIDNPFLTQAQNLLHSGLSYSPNTPSSQPGIGNQPVNGNTEQQSVAPANQSQSSVQSVIPPATTLSPSNYPIQNPNPSSTAYNSPTQNISSAAPNSPSTAVNVPSAPYSILPSVPSGSAPSAVTNPYPTNTAPLNSFPGSNQGTTTSPKVGQSQLQPSQLQPSQLGQSQYKIPYP